MLIDARTAYIIGHIWLVGSFGLPLFSGWIARSAVILVAAAWLFYASVLHRRALVDHGESAKKTQE